MNERKDNDHIKKEKLRPLYSELQGYLSQTPERMKTGEYIQDESLWSQFNTVIGLISEVTGEDYTRFEIKPIGGYYVSHTRYRQSLGGIISYLHGKYFSEELAPFSGGPNTIISQSQQQSQSVLIQMVLDMQSKIDEKIGNYEDGSKEKGFMQKLKSSLSSITNVTDLIAKLSKIANDNGLNLDDVSNIFS